MILTFGNARRQVQVEVPLAAAEKLVEKISRQLALHDPKVKQG